MTLLLGITFGLAVVGVAVGLILLAGRGQTAVVLSNGYSTNGSNGYSTNGTYKNEEKWSVVKDNDGRVKDIIVHRTATVL